MEKITKEIASLTLEGVPREAVEKQWNMIVTGSQSLRKGHLFGLKSIQ